ncbi:MAG: hypothetical protein WEC82_00040 [Xanthobacteraceae bacterium]
MISSLLLRVSVVLLLVGLIVGIAMGIKQDFTLAPAHAHLNLVGGVLMFLAGLYYRLVPQATVGILPKTQAWLQVIGAIVFPLGIGGVMLYGPEQFEVFTIGGALIVIAAIVLFAVVVFRTSAVRT